VLPSSGAGGPDSPLAVTALRCSKQDPNRESEEEAKRLQNGRVIFLEGLGQVGAFLRSDLSIPIVKTFLKDLGIKPKSS